MINVLFYMRGFQTFLNSLTSLGTRAYLQKAPPYLNFHLFLLKGAVYHFKVTNPDALDGELGVEGK